MKESGWSQRNPGMPPLVHRPIVERVREAAKKVAARTHANNRPQLSTPEERKERAEELRRAADKLEENK